MKRFSHKFTTLSVIWLVLGLSIGVAKAQNSEDALCESLKHCEFILKTHTALEYDYIVLAQGFDQFSRVGTENLLNWAIEPTTKHPERGLEILSLSYNAPQQDDLKRIAAHWQEEKFSQVSAASLTDYLTRVPTPAIYSAAIGALNHSNPGRAQQARDILERLPADNKVYPYSIDDFTQLFRAISKKPDENIVRHIAAINTPAARSALQGTLRSGHALRVKIAYQALYDKDRQAAFESLLQTLRSLKPVDGEAAKAISILIRQSNALRSDDFHLRFAADLTADQNMSLMGRVVGLDVLTLSNADLPEMNMVAELYKMAVQLYAKSELPEEYFAAFAQLKPRDHKQAFLALANAAGNDPLLRLRLLDVVKTYGFSAITQNTLLSEFSKQDDYRVLDKAIYVAAMTLTPTNGTIMQTYASGIEKNTPLLSVKTSAAALINLTTKPELSREKRADHYQGFRADYMRRAVDVSADCTITPTNISKRADQMPYFSPITLDAGSRSLRAWLQTAVRFPGGWLAGYELPDHKTALVAYDYDTELGVEIKSDHIQGELFAIVPRSDAVASFWIITTGENLTYIYKLDNVQQDMISNLDISRYLTLPVAVEAIEITTKNELYMAFQGPQSPLRLSRSGNLTPFCAQQTADSTLSYGTRQ